MHNYKELKVWNKAVELSTVVYSLCAEFPKEERYGLKSQMQRSAVSIASNIAEGAGRNSDKEFRQFLAYAYGSCYELETQVIISRNVGLIENEISKSIQNQIIEITKMLYVLSKSLVSEV
ncbi:MAG: four helix bundle protein [Cyclobacteriaceae bacterium]|nr:four helix bundle protein [Cyclobacteriaceae bacterium]